MADTRRAFLRATVIAPVVAGAWVVYDWQTGRLKVRRAPAVCCVPGGSPGKTCGHPVKAAVTVSGVAS